MFALDETLATILKNEDRFKDVVKTMNDALVDKVLNNCMLARIWHQPEYIDPKDIENKEGYDTYYILKEKDNDETRKTLVLSWDGCPPAKGQEYKHDCYSIPIVKHSTERYTYCTAEVQCNAGRYVPSKILDSISKSLAKSIDRSALQVFDSAIGLTENTIETDGANGMFVREDIILAKSALVGNNCARYIIMHPSNLLEFISIDSVNIECAQPMPTLEECARTDISQDTWLMRSLNNGQNKCWLEGLEVVISDEVKPDTCYILRERESVGDFCVGEGRFEIKTEFGQIQYQADIEIGFNVHSVESIYAIRSCR